MSSSAHKPKKSPPNVVWTQIIFLVALGFASFITVLPTLGVSRPRTTLPTPDFTFSVADSSAERIVLNATVPDEHTSYTLNLADPTQNNLILWAAGFDSTQGGVFAVAAPTSLANTWARDGNYDPQPVFGSYLGQFATAPPGTCAAPTPPDTSAGDPYRDTFDGQYAASGSVLIDPTGHNPMMFYEAENHCRAGYYVQGDYYASIGFTRALNSDGTSWPTPTPDPATRVDVIDGPFPKPDSTSTLIPLGDSIPAAMIVDTDPGGSGTKYVYVVFEEHIYGPNNHGDSYITVAQATLSPDGDVPTFHKWNGTDFTTVPGTMAANDNMPNPGATLFDPNNMSANGTCMSPHSMKMPSIYQYETKYLLTLSCVRTGMAGARGVYWAEATDLTAQDWTALNEAGGFSVPGDCNGHSNEQFNGWYPSMISPLASPNVVQSTGYDVEADGCLTSTRHYAVRAFTITDSGMLRSKQAVTPRPTAHRTPIPTAPPTSK